MTDQLHDDGPYAAELGKILDRIPKKWGRWIDVQAGWFPLVVATDQRLAEIDPNYIVHQIKEKYGTLRYSCASSLDDAGPDVLNMFDAITDDAECTSAVTCQQCGEPGSLRQINQLTKTLCSSCSVNLS